MKIKESIKDHISCENHPNLNKFNITEVVWGQLSECKNQLISVADQSNKTIGFFLGYSIYLGSGGFEGEGIGRFVVRLIEGLLENNKDVLIKIVVNNQNYPVIKEAFKGYILNYHRRLSIESFNDVESINRNVLVDIWIVPYVGMELALRLNKPFILCLHDLVYIHFEEIYKGNPYFYDEFTVIANKLANKAVKIIFNSYFVRDNEGIDFLKLPEEKTKVIRLAPPRKEYDSIRICDENDFRNKYKLHDSYIVYPSVIRFHKNHDRLIEGFLKFKGSDEGAVSNLNLVLTDNYKNRPKEKEIREILNKCKNMSIRNSVIFLGRLSWEDVPLLYKYAEGTIIPTFFEGSCPFQILESLIMDTPVAMSKIDVIEEVIPDLRSFITFDPYSLEEIEEAINQLCKAKRKDLKKQKKAVQQTLKRTWTDVAMEYYDLITEIIS
ncbi:glycosyltransferase [Maledivibacter halophilus]|uniref:Glycosyltransferase involved in cell wall bisynthesis n=1 Tax=Maledivibacter halophilus TaxID=36842 RepID=A0A1T5L1A9_9FIRM|nr:glycosyltransferase [Maledivibacter halophilus]SKC69807.1 Glycosyltransferase involved in cell wall bisynthesis [Maledivibacter halophilus]